ncbi:MAG: hypothetical protein RL338_338 [Chloroflexota bacterium]|jgi:hypothetical protein
MTSDRTRATATLVAIVATLAVNGAATAIPLGGRTTGEISDSFRVFLVPSGATFAIWGVIYSFLVAFGVYQARSATRGTPLLRRLGWLPVVSCLFNGAWILLWQYEIFVPTLAAMLGLLVTLIAIHRVTRAATTRAERWLVAIPFSIYLGWITVATVLNVAVALVTLGVTGIAGLEPPLIAAVVLVAAIGIALTAIVREREIAYGLVAVWAFYGIWVKEAATPYVAPVAIAGAGLFVLAVGWATLERRRGWRSPAAA